MDWVSHSNSRPHSTVLSSQLARATHANEFVPRVISGSSSASPNIFNSTYSPVLTSPAAKKLDNSELSSRVTPESASPPPNGSPTLAIADSGSNSSLPAYQENVGGTTYFYHQYPAGAENCVTPQASVDVLPNNTSLTADVYNVYTVKQPDQSFFISEDIRNDILNRNVLTLLQADPQQYPDLPQEVDNYHELFPLEPINNTLHKTHLGHQASMYKATHVKSGIHYCLRRIHNFRLQNTKCMAYVDLWKKLAHSNIVQLKEVFTTKAFGDNSMIFVYDFHPGSETLLHKHFSPDQSGYSDPFLTDTSTPRPYSYQKNNLLRHQQNNKLPEPLIWNYIIQLTSALRLIHSSSLAYRSLDPTKIIITSRNRLRLSCLGMMDVVSTENTTSNSSQQQLIHFNQQEDLTALGKLVLALACKSTMAVQRDNISIALEMVSRSYTQDLRNLIVYLLSSQQRRSVTDLMPMIGARFYNQLDNLHNHIEVLDHELSKEVQNGRLFRLMAKLSTINERPELNMDGTWAETGDRYMLKLFRDYVFHQVGEDGTPWLDMAHIIQCLNKLDTGVPEKICLMSRDEQNILVVSYAELKQCLEQSFHEIALCQQPSIISAHDLSEEKL